MSFNEQDYLFCSQSQAAELVDSIFFFFLIKKRNKKNQGFIKKAKNLNVCLK